MAGDWIKMRTDLHTHPKVVRISSALKADRLRTVGALHVLWSLFDTHSDDGVLDGYTPELIDEHLGWPGFAGALADIEWLQVTGSAVVAPNFDEHNSKTAKRRAKDSVRKTSARNADKTRTREEKRREESNTPLTPQGGSGEIGGVLPSQIAEAHPNVGRPGGADAEVHRALSRIVNGEDPKPPDVDEWPPTQASRWLLERTKLYAKSAEAKRGQMTATAKTWFREGGYRQDPKAWNKTGKGTTKSMAEV